MKCYSCNKSKGLNFNASSINKFSEYLFTNDWTLGDEIKLLGTIERLSLNNREEISKILGKEKFEYESYYYTFYYKSKSDFLPDEKIIKINNTSKNSKNILQENKNEENKYINKIKQNIGYIPFTNNNRQNRSEERKNIKARLNQLLCYKNLRCNTYDEIQKYKFKLCDNKDICSFILNIVNTV